MAKAEAESRAAEKGVEKRVKAEAESNDSCSTIQSSSSFCKSCERQDMNFRSSDEGEDVAPKPKISDLLDVFGANKEGGTYGKHE